MSLKLSFRGTWKITALLITLCFLWSGLVYSAPANAQGTDELCSGANLDLSNNKQNCKTEDGTDRGKECKDSTGKVIACADNSLNNLITQIVNVFSIIVGVVAVIMLIYGGFRYVTSGGDSGNVDNAKKTVVYALVGLVIVALAQIIVKFVLNRVTT